MREIILTLSRYVSHIRENSYLETPDFINFDHFLVVVMQGAR